MKRLAIQGHDNENEINFFAQEIISARFVTDWPLIWRIWSAKAWSGLVRFWCGWLYQFTSSFGRSLICPFVLWAITIILAAGYFLGQSPGVTATRKADIAAGASSGVLTYAISSIAAWQKGEPCFAGPPDTNLRGERIVTGLAEPLRRSTNAAREALHLAFRNALVFVDTGTEAAYRTFGCLYGVERVAVVPSSVSWASTVQKIISGVLIFLFGLAVRNMLRMK